MIPTSGVPTSCVIVGGGPAASAAAATLRAAGFDGSVVIISAEDVAPYQRPPLSKDFLTGVSGAADLELRPGDWYAANDVDLRLGTRASAIDVGARDVVLAGGRRVRYDRLLLATGGVPRRLPDVDSERVLYLRDLADAEALAKRMVPGEPLVVLGGGFIGCEVAASARTAGVEVTVLEMADVPLQRVLGDDVGAVMADIHRDQGVTLRTGERVESVDTGRDGVVISTDRGRLECATLLVAVGLTPSTELVAGTGVQIDETSRGIVVDRYCETSVPGIFAAGDVAAHDHPGYGRRIRVEHHDNALKQGSVAARNMLGAHEPYSDLHWFWSDQYHHNLQSIGRTEGCDRTVVRGSVADRMFSVFALSEGRVRAVFALDRGMDIIGGKRLITSGTQVSVEQLRDESVNLKRLATTGRNSP